MRAVAAVLPFRVNDYVVEELIDWSAVPDDPIFRLTFPQREMLGPTDFEPIHRLIRDGASDREVEAAAVLVRARLNPHPGGQRELNVPSFEGEPLAGAQHKYADTLLAFPAEGQTCHAYCGYCFRWAQFVGPREARFAHGDPERIADYVRAHPRISDVLLTGGDPLVARAEVLRRHLAPLLAPDLERVNIRIGTKAPAYWPHRFLGDRDADPLLRLFEEVVAAGRHLTLVVHFSHPRELGTDAASRALARILATGATVRCQAPVVRHVNDSAAVWAELWSLQVRAGAIPYYMFVERDTGPRRYFELSLARALEIYEGASALVSGLARTARGPVMSAAPGKVLVDGTVEVGGERAFVLKLIRARQEGRTNEVSLARYDETATWLDQLRPPAGEWGITSHGRANGDASWLHPTAVAG
jgi:L-lysine 2,3-aminomutase